MQRNLDAFLARITPLISGQLERGSWERELIVVEDERGLEITGRVAPEVQAHDALTALLEAGATGAAIVNYLPDQATVFVRVSTASPPDSDTRRATVQIGPTGVTLGNWEYVVP